MVVDRWRRWLDDETRRRGTKTRDGGEGGRREHFIRRCETRGREQTTNFLRSFFVFFRSTSPSINIARPLSPLPLLLPFRAATVNKRRNFNRSKQSSRASIEDLQLLISARRNISSLRIISGQFLIFYHET